jgi:5-methylcytosine-specific restriction endonuclease McrA
MNCENCGKEIKPEDDYRAESSRKRKKPLRFCSRSCANAHSHSQAQREKASASLKEYFSKNEVWNKGKTTSQNASCEKRELRNLFDMSKRTISKVLKRLKIHCSRCDWYEEGVVGDVHHIIPKKVGGSDEHTNLTYLCPNCHRTVHSGKIDSTELKTIQEQIGDTWKDVVFYKK